MFTAEFAVAMLAVMPLVLSIVAMAGVAGVHVRTVETARTAARLLARGEDQSAVRAAVAEQLPGSVVDIRTTPLDARVEVSRRVAPLGLLPTFTVHAQAITPLESGHAP